MGSDHVKSGISLTVQEKIAIFDKMKHFWVENEKSAKIVSFQPILDFQKPKQIRNPILVGSDHVKLRISLTVLEKIAIFENMAAILDVSIN